MPEQDTRVEPWLRGTRHQVPAVARAVLHALDLTREDFSRWVWSLPPQLIEDQVYNLPSLGFQARHIARSLDRLLTYAEGNQLSEHQRALLHAEAHPIAPPPPQEEFEAGLQMAESRVLALPLDCPDEMRHVGTAKIQTTLGGLLIHLADHTQRHAGQAVTTAKVLSAVHGAEQS